MEAGVAIPLHERDLQALAREQRRRGGARRAAPDDEDVAMTVESIDETPLALSNGARIREKYNPCGSICAPKGLNLVAFFGSLMPSMQSAAEAELAELIISAVNLEGVAPADVDPDAPLFGAGLGLDSIDALELALEISKRYGFQLRSDDEENRRIFASLRSLSEYIQKNRTT